MIGRKGLFVGLWMLTLPLPRIGATHVVFDVEQIVVGNSLESSAASEHQIAFPLSISVILSGGAAEELVQCEFEFRTYEPVCAVTDFTPQTQLVTDVQGSVSYTRDFGDQQGKQVGGGGNVDGVVRAELSASTSTHDSTSAHFERLPTRQLLTAAGTTRRGTGVFFKMRKTSQTTLEGSHPFSVTLALPEDWRAGYLRVLCRPTLRGRGPQPSQSFLVPICREGDREARDLARDLIDAEHRLLMLSRVHAKQVERARRPTLVHQLSLSGPELPKNWLELAIWNDPTWGPPSFERVLPSTIQQALEHFRECQQSVRALNGYVPDENMTAAVGPPAGMEE